MCLINDWRSALIPKGTVSAIDDASLTLCTTNGEKTYNFVNTKSLLLFHIYTSNHQYTTPNYYSPPFRQIDSPLDNEYSRWESQFYIVNTVCLFIYVTRGFRCILWNSVCWHLFTFLRDKPRTFLLMLLLSIILLTTQNSSSLINKHALRDQIAFSAVCAVRGRLYSPAVQAIPTLRWWGRDPPPLLLIQLSPPPPLPIYS